jgi:hypothetical protein
MAFDLLSGETTKRSWSRGDMVADLAVSRAKKLPWKKIFAGTGIAAGLGIVAIAVTNPEHKGRRELRRRDDPRLQHDEWSTKTQELPPETMRQLLELRKRA